jgi:hypothetical protein
MTFEPDTEAALKFLELWQPGGPWTLTSIVPDPPDRNNQKIATISTTDAIVAKEFIECWNGGRNLYFCVNPTHKLQNKKAKSTDISHLAALHVDLDPRVGEDLTGERKRILDALHAYPLQPSFIIDSGGGYQAFWKLEKPEQITDSEDAKLWNLALENDLGGDNCHNVDRIMRLPGTVNIPNTKKRNQGRKPSLAQLHDHNDKTYSLNLFTKAKAISDNKPNLQISITNVERVLDLDKLDKWDVPDRVKIIIAQGRLPEERKKGDDSRSAWLFDAVCNLLRKDVPDEVIYAILTDQEWGIAESVLERKSDAAKYALRTIEQAKRKVAMDNSNRPPGTMSEEVERINNDYFAALSGGKVRFWRENKDNTIEPMDKAAFLFELAPRRYKDSDNGLKPIAPIWMNQHNRRYYPAGFVLDPDRDCNDSAYNLWRGFSCEPQAGDWSLMRAHITEVLADGDEGYADYIIKWTAWSLQNPATPPRVALVFRGGQGIGKGIFAGAVADIFGTHGMRIQNMNHLVGKFNAHLRHLCLLFADEAVVPNSESEGTLKGLITEHTIPIEAKGVDVVNAENHLHVIMATNNEYAVPAAGDARRFAVFDVSDRQQGNPDYFNALAAEMEQGGKAAMLHDMLAMPLDGFHPERCRPNTDALSEQMNLSMQPAEMAIQNILREGEVPCDYESRHKEGRIFVATSLLSAGLRLEQRQVTTLGNLLRIVSGTSGIREYVGTGVARHQRRGYWLPPLELARQNWERHIGRAVKWPDGVTTWAIEAEKIREPTNEMPF